MVFTLKAQVAANVKPITVKNHYVGLYCFYDPSHTQNFHLSRRSEFARSTVRPYIPWVISLQLLSLHFKMGLWLLCWVLVPSLFPSIKHPIHNWAWALAVYIAARNLVMFSSPAHTNTLHGCRVLFSPPMPAATERVHTDLLFRAVWVNGCAPI